MNKRLLEKLNTLPDLPGVYKFLNKKSEILYVGKALNLKKRVTSYFQSDISQRPRIVQMMPLVSDFEVIETNNEIEALILESALVKKHKPYFNTQLKDDKSYAWIYINSKDEIPTVKIVRTIKKGEYSRGKLFGPYPSGLSIKRVYTYLRKLYPFCTCKNKDCSSSLYFHIGLCPGPYAGAITKKEYRKNINSIIRFLSGKQQNHIKRLEREMKIYSKQQDYEKATQLRDRINDLKYIGQDIDFTYYDDTESYESRRSKARKSSFNSLSIELGIPKLERIECYDISNIQGKHAYGSMVVAIEGKLDRSEYRIFKIRGLDTPNDFKMLEEVLERRFKHKENLPQLVLIDGGKGQLNSVKDVIPKDIFLMGISKGRYLKRRGKTLLDEYWIFNGKEILRVDIDSPEILIDLRNEAHRFAISHFRKESIKQSKVSKLDSIEGIGEKRRKGLIKTFGDIEGIKKATDGEIYKVVKNKEVIKRIRTTL
ncbi:MAG: excinuclease ABC subunit UvrC [Candidatus Dojkabacteria bacterium]|jgi:excinuclease ABC subunit C|nr:excinuclease ABC subunit UvrC [Candidatus Dojkabacteria bacterium]